MSESHLQDVVAKAYAAIAEPQGFLDLMADIIAADESLGGIDGKADMHFDNAGAILDKMYPLEDSDYAVLHTHDAEAEQAGDAAPIGCDLALSRDFRVAALNTRIFQNAEFAVGDYAPDWLLGIADGNTQRSRMKALLNGASSDAGDADDKAFFRLHIAGETGSTRWFVGRVTDHPGTPLIALDMVRVRWDKAGGDAFQKALALTDTELALVQHLVGGGTVREFAEMRGRSVGTARNQLKALQRKLSISSKEELLLLYAGFVHSLEEQGDDTPQPTHVCENLFTAADGSTIAWEEFGDPDGKPVLFFHPLHGSLTTRMTVKSAAQAGLRIIAPWRPHYGHTSGGSAGKQTPRAFATRIPEFLAHLGLGPSFGGKVAGLATQAGMPYLMGLAQEHPELLHGCIGACPALPMASAEDYAFLPRRQRNHMRVGRIAPAFAKAYMRAMLASMGTGKFFRFVDDYYEDCPDELATAREPEMVDMLRRSSFYALQDRYLGPTDTMLNWAADWSGLFANLKVPVLLIAADGDFSTPPEFARLAAAKYGLLDPVIVPDANSFIVYRNPDPVMRELAALF